METLNHSVPVIAVILVPYGATSMKILPEQDECGPLSGRASCSRL